MRRLSMGLAGLMCISVGCGCHDAEGRSVSMRDWWDVRFGGGSAKRSEDESSASSARSRADAAPGKATGPAAESADAESRMAGDDARGDVDRGGGAAPVEEAPVIVSAERRPPGPRAIHPNVLIVNDEAIHVSDILEPIQARLEQAAASETPSAYAALRNDTVRRQIIEAVAEQLIWQEARHHVNEEIEEQLDKRVDQVEKERINREFGGRETQYVKYLARHGKSRSDVRERLRRGVIIDHYLYERLLPMIPAPTKRELQKHYDAHRQDEFTTPGRREMWLIDMPAAAFVDRRRPFTRAAADAAMTAARAAAEEAAEALRGGEEFESVARRLSRLRRDEGGAWGFISDDALPLQGRYEAPSRRLMELEPGAVSDIIEAEQSFFIVKAGRIEPARTLSFQDAQEKIAQSLRQTKFARYRAEFLQKQFDRSHVGSLEMFFQQALAAAPAPNRAGLSQGPGNGVAERRP